MDTYEVKRVVRATPKRLFEAWLDSREHSDMTRRTATVSSVVGAQLTVLDGVVKGRNLEIEPYHRIVQTWRVVTVGGDAFDTQVEIVLSTTADSDAIANTHDDGVTLTVRHSGLPRDQFILSAEWWEERYFRPMDVYFAQGNLRFMRPSL